MMRHRDDPMENARLIISGELIPEDSETTGAVLKDVLRITEGLRIENRKLKNRRGDGSGCYLTKKQIYDALDSLYSEEIDDGDLLSDVLTHLGSMQDFPYRLFLARYVHARFLCKESVKQGYGLDDVIEFVKWFDEVEEAHHGQEQSSETQAQETKEDRQAETG